jgi:hypothetical protein
MAIASDLLTSSMNRTVKGEVTVKSVTSKACWPFSMTFQESWPFIFQYSDWKAHIPFMTFEKGFFEFFQFFWFSVSLLKNEMNSVLWHIVNQSENVVTFLVSYGDGTLNFWKPMVLRLLQAVCILQLKFQSSLFSFSSADQRLVSRPGGVRPWACVPTAVRQAASHFVGLPSSFDVARPSSQVSTCRLKVAIMTDFRRFVSFGKRLEFMEFFAERNAAKGAGRTELIAFLQSLRSNYKDTWHRRVSRLEFDVFA